MPLQAGNKLGPYEIVALLGAGGMGEVYRAHDTKLGRDVAIKVLPAAFASDPTRMARFEREAKVLASLNHSNIAHIYGVAESSDVRALVMELVEGASPKGPMRFDEAWKIALQIAAALEYAHDKGVIHRDLKPANVKVTPEGVVKLLDFGLAKAYSGDPEAGSGDPSLSPTITLGATVAGTVMGTAAYMPPEQARGKPVDKRADIWSWGVVLYELITGEQLFQGEDAAETLAAVIHKQPDLEKAPPQVRKLLGRCLEKDPKKRLRDIGDAKDLLEEPATAPSPSRFRWAWPAAAALLAVIAAALAFIHFREQPPPAEPVRFQIPAPEKNQFIAGGYISPDGSKVVFPAAGADGVRRLWIRRLDSLASRSLEGTENFGNSPPVWSPDSKSIAFPVNGRLKKIDAAGGPAQTLADFSGGWRGGAWVRDGKGSGIIIFGTQGKALMRVPESGGTPSPVTVLDASRDETAHAVPSFLPDGRHFIYLRLSSKPEDSGIYLGSLDSKPAQQGSKLLVATQSPAVYAPSANPAWGYILFVRENSLMAQPFDDKRLEISGDAAPIAEGFSPTAAPAFSASQTALAYRIGATGGSAVTRLIWFDRGGKPLGTVGDPGEYNTVALSPDGKRVAVSRVDPQDAGNANGGNMDLWVHDLAQGNALKLTFDPGTDAMATWSPDGNRIIFVSDRDGVFNLYQHASNGTGGDEVLLKSAETKFSYDWSSEGRFLLYAVVHNGLDLWYLPLTGDDRKPRVYLATQFDEEQARFSPDVRFVAYASNATGKSEIYVRPFPMASAGQWQISVGGGSQPRWRRDGKELYYISADAMMMAVDMSKGPQEHGVPKALFAAPIWGGYTPSNVTRYDVTADGSKFLINALAPETGSAESAPVTVVLNWQTGLKK